MSLRHPVRAIVLDEEDRILLCRLELPEIVVWTRPVWRHEAVEPGYAEGHEGVVNEYFLVRVASFEPRGAMTDREPAAENVSGRRWWSLPGIAGFRG
ncbi:hypothetical protein LZG04_36655 [Saccharothrix sp. S26]|uniref:hypothetical protein n=1 Tax=Saccharothrix sp. S26 TaxID=2907215 RepID=UPI001F3FB80F|nr:hypothetical protein [Saccharothrix sp. S26]MCE7000308.1 hypothetical protein [Saccharothrix sp. S26]